jgi:YD repeat-containing protein
MKIGWIRKGVLIGAAPRVARGRPARVRNHDGRYPRGVIRSVMHAAMPVGRVRVLAMGLVICSGVGSVPASAQIYPMPPEVRLEDENNVDLMGGLPSADIAPVTIGDNQNGMSVSLSFDNQLLWRTSLEAGIEPRGEMTVLYTGKAAEKMIGYSGQGANDYSTYSGAKYICDTSTSVLTDRNGTVYTFDTNSNNNCSLGKVTHVTMPNGLERTYYYNEGGPLTYVYGPLTVVQSNGYVFKTIVDSSTKLRFVLFNSNVDNCAPTATQCTFSRSWPTITLEVKPGTVGLSDIYVSRGAGETTVLKGDNYDGGAHVLPYGRLIQVFKPDAGSTPTISYQLCRRTLPFNCYYYTGSYGIGGGTQVAIPDKVTYSTRNGVTWSYNYVTNIGPVNYQYASYRPDGQSRMMQAYSYQHQSWPVYLSLPHKKVGFSNTEASRLTAVSYGQGNAEGYSYDQRGNILETRNKAVLGSGLTDLVTTVVYPSSCANMKNCNKPTSVTDAKGQTTSFGYSAEGLLLTETSPPDANGIAAVKRYSYVQRSPWVRDAGGGFSPMGLIWLLAEDRICRTTSTVNNACTGGASDEVVTSYDYGPTSGANNLLLRSVTVSADGTSLKTCFTYDAQGNRISTTKPLGSALGGCQ